MADDATAGESGATEAAAEPASPKPRARHALPKEMKPRRLRLRRRGAAAMPPVPDAEPAPEPEDRPVDPGVAAPEAAETEIETAEDSGAVTDEASGQPGDADAEDAGDDAPESDAVPAGAAEDGTAEITVDDLIGKPRRRWSPIAKAAAAGIVMVFVLAGLTGYLGWQDQQVRRQEQLRAQFLDAGRNAAIVLTSIRFDSIDDDMARLLEISTDKFHDDLDRRRETFVEVLKEAEGVASGAVVSAGVAEINADEAVVLVAVDVEAANQAESEQKQNRWRMRLMLREIAPGEIKVSRVEYVA